MAHYEGKKNIHHWFPKVNHISDHNRTYDEQEPMIIDDGHDSPYIGDFPPRDDYSDGNFY